MLDKIHRKKTKKIRVGSLTVGGDSPIWVQSMTNTNTADHIKTIAQINTLINAGVDLVRISVPDDEAVTGLKKIRDAIHIPLIADIHFNYKLALASIEAGVDCVRINPGNIGSIQKITQVVQACKDNDIAMRIGVNAGSLEKDIQTKYGEPNARALVESAMRQVDILDRLNFDQFKVAVKSSDTMMTVQAYETLSKQINQPLHLGVTEAGSLQSGTVKSSIALGTLLAQGIGDTLRVSLSADPVEEVKVGFHILKSLHLRKRGINIISCPSCSRQEFDVIDVVNTLEKRLEDIKEPLDVAIIGCIVNGPGEAKNVQIGLTGGKKRHLIYVNGEIKERLESENLVNYLEKKIRSTIDSKNI